MAQPRKVADWDSYFLSLARLVATRSKHPRSQHGAVLVNPSKRIVATGYNGCPSGFPDDEVDWGSGMTWTNKDWTIHAEENALLYAGRESWGCTIYVTGRPCPRCLLRIIHCGVVRIVCGASSYSKEDADNEVFQRIVQLSGIAVEHA